MAFTIHLVTRGSRPTTAEDHAVQAFRSRLEGDAASKVRRLTVHIEETVDMLATPRPKPEWVCRVKVMLAAALDEPSFVVEGRASHAREAVDLAADAVEGAARRVVELATRKGHRRPAALVSPPSGPKRISLRRGERQARRGEEPARAPTVSASPPRGRHFHMTRVQAGATSEREEAAPPAEGEKASRPSRKSTRKSANRSKRDSNQLRRDRRALGAPEARAERAQARAQKTRGHAVGRA